jgi:hypothetical protein
VRAFGARRGRLHPGNLDRRCSWPGSTGPPFRRGPLPLLASERHSEPGDRLRSLGEPGAGCPVPWPGKSHLRSPARSDEHLRARAVGRIPAPERHAESFASTPGPRARNIDSGAEKLHQECGFPRGRPLDAGGRRPAVSESFPPSVSRGAPASGGGPDRGWMQGLLAVDGAAWSGVRSVNSDEPADGITPRSLGEGEGTHRSSEWPEDGLPVGVCRWFLRQCRVAEARQ